MSTNSRPLRVFLCHASEDKSTVRELYQRLKAGGVEPWLDEEDLIAGQDWELQIRRAVRNTDIVLVCLSQRAVDKRGFVQKEVKLALDVADEQPEGAIFIIPVKLEECAIPERLMRWHWVNYFEERGHERLLRALQEHAASKEAQFDASSQLYKRDSTATPLLRTTPPLKQGAAQDDNIEHTARLVVVDSDIFGINLSQGWRLSKDDRGPQVAAVEFFRETDEISLSWIEVRANVEFYDLGGKRLARVNEAFWFKEHEELTQTAKFQVGDSRYLLIAVNTSDMIAIFNGHMSKHRVVTTYVNEFIPNFEKVLEVEESFVRVRLLSTRGGRTVLDETFDFSLSTKPKLRIKPFEESTH